MIKYIFEDKKRLFIEDYKSKKTKPFLLFNYEKDEWESLIKTYLNKRKITFLIISLTMILISLISFYFKNKEGRISGVIFLLISVLFSINYFIFNIKPLLNLLHSESRNLKSFKFEVFISSELYLIKQFDIFKNYSRDKHRRTVTIEHIISNSDIVGEDIRKFKIPMPSIKYRKQT